MKQIASYDLSSRGPAQIVLQTESGYWFVTLAIHWKRRSYHVVRATDDDQRRWAENLVGGYCQVERYAGITHRLGGRWQGDGLPQGIWAIADLSSMTLREALAWFKRQDPLALILESQL